MGGATAQSRRTLTPPKAFGETLMFSGVAPSTATRSAPTSATKLNIWNGFNMGDAPGGGAAGATAEEASELALGRDMVAGRREEEDARVFSRYALPRTLSNGGGFSMVGKSSPTLNGAERLCWSTGQVRHPRDSPHTRSLWRKDQLTREPRAAAGRPEPAARPASNQHFKLLVSNRLSSQNLPARLLANPSQRNGLALPRVGPPVGVTGAR